MYLENELQEVFVEIDHKLEAKFHLFIISEENRTS